MDVMRNIIGIELELLSVCVICVVRTVKVWITFCGNTHLNQAPCIILQYLKKTLGKGFELFKSFGTARRSLFF